MIEITLQLHAAVFSAPPGRSETDETDQTVLAEARLRLWLSQAPSGLAGQRATLRSEQSLATH